ncbi:MAG TPA: MFS transporter [Sphingomonadaceae bacterium]|nr:MFS transporter [Sphingomonadaceae bacterium]
MGAVIPSPYGDSGAADKSLAYEIRVILLLGLSFGFAYYDRMMMAFLGPFVVKDFHLNNFQVGALGAALSLTWALGAYVFGRWSDRSGRRKPFIVAALVIFSLCSVFSGLSTGFWSLLFSRMLMGAVEGPFLPICLAIIVFASAQRRQGLNAGIVQNVFGSLLGTAVAPLTAVAIAQAWGWKASFYTAAIPGLILAFLVWRFIAEPPPPPAPVAGRAEEKGIGAMLRERNMLLCSLISCLLVGAITLGSIFLPLYLTQIRGFAPESMAGIMALLGLCPPIGGVVVTWISDRIGRRPPMILFSALVALCPFAALYYVGAPAILSGLMFVGWIGLGVFPLFMGVVPAETLGPRHAATAMGLVIAAGELSGGVVAPLVAGRIADLYGLSAPLLIAGVMALFAGGLATMLIETNPRKKRRPDSEEPQAPPLEACS